LYLQLGVGAVSVAGLHEAVIGPPHATALRVIRGRCDYRRIGACDDAREVGIAHKGSCHCGGIAFEVEGEPEQVVACNCSHCSRKGYLLWFVPRTGCGC